MVKQVLWSAPTPPPVEVEVLKVLEVLWSALYRSPVEAELLKKIGAVKLVLNFSAPSGHL